MPASEGDTLPPDLVEALRTLNIPTTGWTRIIPVDAGEGPNLQPNKGWRLPASKKSIADMPLVKIITTTTQAQGMDMDMDIDDGEAEVAEEEPSSCAICLGEYEYEVELAKEMPCRHRYHPDCIDKWLGVHGTCPVCRYQMPLEEEEDQQEDHKGISQEAGRRQRAGEIRIIRFRRSNEGGARTQDGPMEIEGGATPDDPMQIY